MNAIQKVLVAAGVGPALVMGAAPVAQADDGYHGSKGDHSARAFWEDTGRMAVDPERFATTVCRVRACERRQRS